MTEKEISLCIEMQDMLRKAMGTPQWGDRFLSPKGEEYTLLPESFKLNVYWEDQLKGHAWLPKSIDSETPERGLQGMIKNFEFLSDNSSHWVCSFWTEISPTAEEKWSEGSTPTEALLRALRAQKEDVKQKVS